MLSIVKLHTGLVGFIHLAGKGLGIFHIGFAGELLRFTLANELTSQNLTNLLRQNTHSVIFDCFDVNSNWNGSIDVCRSIACPMVKNKDEWGDPEDCDRGDNCPYCHTRMELQYHPDVRLISTILIKLQISRVTANSID